MISGIGLYWVILRRHDVVTRHTAGRFRLRILPPPQDEIIQCVVDGCDALVLMPTGGGKSLCYQIPAIARPGCGVVISPLIALMQDQVTALEQLGVRASYLNSTLASEAAQADPGDAGPFDIGRDFTYRRWGLETRAFRRGDQ